MKEGCDIIAFKYWITPETVNSQPFLEGVANPFGQTRFVWNSLKDYVDKKLANHEKLPSKIALLNLIWLAIKNSTKEWSKSVFKWRQALLERE